MSLAKRKNADNIIQTSRGIAANIAKTNYKGLEQSEIENQATRIHGVESEKVRRGMNIKHLQAAQELTGIMGDESVEKIKLVGKVIENQTKILKAESEHLIKPAEEYKNTRTRLAYERTMNARKGIMSAAG